MNKLLFALVLSLPFLPSLADAATINAASCSYDDVQAAVNATQSGDTVLVPTGNCTWGSRLAITKSVYIIGAGIGQTIINNSYAPSLSGGSLDATKHLISIVPATPADNPQIRISGFTFNFGTTSFGIYYANPSTTYDCTNVRLDHLDISAYYWVFQRYGLAHGVMDNCNIKGLMDGGGSSTLWTTNGYEYGTASNFYFEDNTWQPYSSTREIVQAGNGAFRYAYRYNKITLPTDTQTFPLFDQHGNQGQTGCFGAEIYGNNITANNLAQRWFNMIYDQRGGKSLVYDNTVEWSTTGVDVGMRLREEHQDSEGEGLAINAINGQPQHISDSYYWGNTKNGAALIPSLSNELGVPCSTCGVNVPTENVHVWLEKTPFNGTSGIGCGTLATMQAISTCTEGVGFWVTDQSCTNFTGMVGSNPVTPISGTLYRCTSTNTWSAYYTPYTYPHPLRTDCVNYPGLCDSSAATINAASCSQQDVQTAINNASDGDTIMVPAGNCTWTTITAGTPAVTIPHTKGLIIKGAGVDQTIIQDHTGTNYGESLLRINNAEGKPFRLTGIRFIRNIDAGSSNTAMIIVSGSSKNWRIDHCNIEYTSTTGVTIAIITDGYTYGVIDNCSFTNTYPVVFADEDASWNRPLALGTSNAVFIEDCTYINAAGSFQFSTDGRSGGRFVFRRNTLTNFQFGTHGTDGGGDRGIHTYEFYSNKLVADGTVNCYRVAELRGGTGVVFNNTVIGNWGEILVQHNCACTTDPNDSRCGGAKICTGYPCLDQIGRTTDSDGNGVEDLVPLFGWNNTDDGIRKDIVISAVCPAVYTYLKEGRDFYNDNVTYNSSAGKYEAQYKDDDNSTKHWSYKPYIYPHPLTLAPFGTDICNEGQIALSCWCEGMKSTGYCCNGYYQTTSCGGVAQPVAGDLDGDGDVDILDLGLVGIHFGRTNTHPQWNATADLVANNEIDIFDVVFVASRFT